MAEELTQEVFMELFNYCKESGVITRKCDMKAFTTKDERGYIKIRIGKKRFRAHRLAFLFMTGKMPNNIDHINGIKDDNRWDNLRECTQNQNCRNRKVNNSSTTGMKNLLWLPDIKQWIVLINVDGKRYQYGPFFDRDIAELVVLGARVKHHGEFANLD